MGNEVVDKAAEGGKMGGEAGKMGGEVAAKAPEGAKVGGEGGNPEEPHSQPPKYVQEPQPGAEPKPKTAVRLPRSRLNRQL